ncbi:MinD/ParA family protein [Metabacillus fastidiosus]|uniref:MinD/ParA family protein n=1 Tax=Metabacillus fastidiosus TaxID=1458 RepID=UPI002E1B20F6|nr:MinD/ParA family protein [Metabacillus fastidiosus]
MAHDQAEHLRKKLKQRYEKKNAYSIAVMSGKGGVGKSNFSLNFALALKQQNQSVLLFDLDIGMGNIDILVGGGSKYTIVDFFERNIPLYEIISIGPEGLAYISGGTGLSSLFHLDEQKFKFFIDELEKVFSEYDFVIFDMGAGITEDSLKFILSVDEIFVIVTPEPTAITDAYAAIKYICINNETIPFSIIVNRTTGAKITNLTFSRLSNTIRQFLKRNARLLGEIPDDAMITNAVLEQVPFLLYQPKSPGSKAIVKLANHFLRDRLKIKLTATPSSTQAFVNKFKNIFMKGR